MNTHTQTPSAPGSGLTNTFAGRLVTLCDGRPGVRSSVHVETCQPADTLDQPIIDFIASDETLDRYDEIVTAAGWDLTAYQRNPVFQNAHQYGDIIFTLGKALLTEIRIISGRSVLYQRIKFATDVSPIARIAHGLYSGKYINGVSVGFVPIKWEDGAPGSGCRRRYLQQQLLEVSAVAIPANPNALALAVKSGAIQKADLADTLDLLRAICPTEPTTLAAPKPGVGGSLLALARNISSLMKLL